MEDNNIMLIFKIAVKTIKDFAIALNDFGRKISFENSRYLDFNNRYSKVKSSINEYTENVRIEDDNSYNDNNSETCYSTQQDAYTNSQGVIDSIAQDLTSVKLQQAIILSEVVGKPRSKIRKKRRRF